MMRNTERSNEYHNLGNFRQVGVTREQADKDEVLLIDWKKQVRHIIERSECKLVQELVEAVQSSATVSIFYQGGVDSGRFRKFTPESVFRKEGSTVTYVAGYCHLRRANRVLRVNRISMG